MNASPNVGLVLKSRTYNTPDNWYHNNYCYVLVIE